MYSKKQFGVELKERVTSKQNIIEISLRAHEIYLDYCDVFDNQFCQLLIILSTMEIGPEFYLTYQMLNKISDDIIAGQAIDLTLKKYK